MSTGPINLNCNRPLLIPILALHLPLFIPISRRGFCPLQLAVTVDAVLSWWSWLTSVPIVHILP